MHVEEVFFQHFGHVTLSGCGLPYGIRHRAITLDWGCKAALTPADNLGPQATYA